MVRTAWFASVAALLVPSMGSAGPVATPAGAMEGTAAGAVIAFKGIPYAAPPVGDLRWRAPRQIRPWTGILKATSFRPACMQRGTSMPGEAAPAISEDCLYLNIWAPRQANRVPVIVWIHGGGFTNGNASMPLYWGDRLARRGAILVTFGYRLGPLGFVAHPALTAESAERTSGNYGLLDQIAALKWVKANIAAFGGDPARITIAGQSAGATSVSLLLASPLAKGLFFGAVAQSGGLFEPVQLAPGYQLERAEQDGEAYAQSLGATTLRSLRAMPAAKLLGGSAGSVSHPVLDRLVLPLSPYDAYVRGTQNEVPILIGSNDDEARSLIPGLSSIRAATYDTDIAKAWGSLPPTLLAAYPHATDAQAVTARLGFERDLRFGWDMWAWARLQAGRSTHPVFYYHFDAHPPFPARSAYAGWGPSHYAELWYMFDHLDQGQWPWTRSDKRLANTMASYWVNFARTGDPNGAGLPAWPAFTAARPATQYLGGTVRTGIPADLATLSVFDTTYAAVRGQKFGSTADN